MNHVALKIKLKLFFKIYKPTLASSSSATGAVTVRQYTLLPASERHSKRSLQNFDLIGCFCIAIK